MHVMARARWGEDEGGAGRTAGKRRAGRGAGIAVEDQCCERAWRSEMASLSHAVSPSFSLSIWTERERAAAWTRPANLSLGFGMTQAHRSPGLRARMGSDGCRIWPVDT